MPEEPKIILAQLYPTFVIAREGIIPDISLPLNFRDLVPRFYERKGKEKVERYKTDLVSLLSDSGRAVQIDLNWDSKLGLTNVSTDTHGGLDLSEDSPPRFLPHNLGLGNSLYAAAITTKYISLLLRTNE
jgi:hypothetical protein